MQDFYPDLAFLVVFTIVCAVDIGIGHSLVAGLVVAGIGLLVIVVFVLVIRYGFRVDESANHVGDPP